MITNFNLNESSFHSYLQLKAIITKITSKGTYIGCHEYLDNSLKKVQIRGEWFQAYIHFICPPPVAIFSHWKDGSKTWVSHRIWKHPVSLTKWGRFRVIQLKIPPPDLKRKPSQAYAGMVVGRRAPLCRDTLSKILSVGLRASRHWERWGDSSLNMRITTHVFRQSLLEGIRSNALLTFVFYLYFSNRNHTVDDIHRDCRKWEL